MNSEVRFGAKTLGHAKRRSAIPFTGIVRPAAASRKNAIEAEQSKSTHRFGHHVVTKP